MIQGLYLITPRGSEQEIVDLVRAGLRGGVRVVQYRDKERAPQEQANLARQLKQLCTTSGATFLVNDSAELAAACHADGVHLGQGDGSVHEARRLLGADKLVGVSTRSVDQALKALKKKMQREGIFREMKLRGHYEKPSEKKAREKAEAIRRARKLARKKMQREGLLPMKPRIIPGAAGPGAGGPGGAGGRGGRGGAGGPPRF